MTMCNADKPGLKSRNSGIWRKHYLAVGRMRLSQWNLSLGHAKFTVLLVKHTVKVQMILAICKVVPKYSPDAHVSSLSS